MAIKTFAAVDVGSYELAMKIYQISPKVGLREIDHIRYHFELGTETYSTGKISNERVNELCRVLKNFKDIMDSYKVDDYKAYGTSAIREAKNTLTVLDTIENQTGLKVDVISNSEQRFLHYKAVASKGEGFHKIIEKGTAIVDIGGGSLQVSLFDQDSLVATQNIRLGVLRICEQLKALQVKPSRYEQLIGEMIGNQLETLKKMYFKGREIENIILVDDYLSRAMQNPAICGEKAGFLTKDACIQLIEFLQQKNRQELAMTFGMEEENITMLFCCSILVKHLLEMLDAKLLWAPGVDLCDGMAYEHAETHKLITIAHDFEKDILACCENISKRYMGSKKTSESVENISLTIFDSMRRVHGLKKRDRFLLQLSARLYDCGKYISMLNAGECSYAIIMATEIIGLSHLEREMVANIVKYNWLDFEYYDELSRYLHLDREAYLTVTKLTAILKLANALNRSHKQKFKSIKAFLKDNELVLTVETSEDITLEKGLFGPKAQFFEEVYSVHPVIKQKRNL